MRTKSLHCTAIIGAAIFLAGCVAGTQVRTQPDAGDPVAEMPKYCLGDTWVWDDKPRSEDLWTAEVVETHDDGGYVVTGKNKFGELKYKYHYDKNTDLTKKTDVIKGEDLTLPPDRKLLEFPLFVGKRWSTQYTGKSVDGKTFRYINTHTVTDYKKMQTKVGELDVYRIWRAHQNAAQHTNRVVRHIYYYAPAIKEIVLSEPAWRDSRQVVKYSAGSCD